MENNSSPFRSPSLESTQGATAVEVELPRKSGLLTAVTVVNYLFGAVNLLGGLFFLTLLIIDLTADAAWTRVVEPAPFDEAIRTILVVMTSSFTRIILVVMTSSFLSMGIGAIFAGAGMQRRRKWGRVLTIFLGVIASLATLVGFLIFVPMTLLYLPYAVFVLVVLLNSRNADHFR